MSRIGKAPVKIAKGVEVTVSEKKLSYRKRTKRNLNSANGFSYYFGNS